MTTDQPLTVLARPAVLAGVVALAASVRLAFAPHDSAGLALALGGVVACALVGRAATRAFGVSAGTLGALVFALYGPTLGGELEATAGAVALAAWLGFEDDAPAWERVAGGAAIALGSFAAPALLVLVPLSAAPLRRRPRALGAVLLGAALALGGAAALGHLPPLSEAVFVGASPLNTTGGRATPAFERLRDTLTPDDYLDEAAARLGRPAGALAASAFWMRDAAALWRSRPGRELALTGQRLLRFWSADVDAGTPLPGFALLVALAALGAVALWREARPFATLALGTWLATSVLYVDARTRLVAAPALAALAGGGVSWLVSTVRWRRWPSLALPLFAAALGAVVALTGRGGAAGEAQRLAARAERLVAAGDPRALDTAARAVGAAPTSEAARLARLRVDVTAGDADAVDRDIATTLTLAEHAETWRVLARALAAAGRVPEARNAWARAAELAPGNAEAMLALGEVLLVDKEPAAAARVFQRRLSFHPEDGAAHRGLALALLDEGKSSEARDEAERAAALGQPVPAGVQARLGLAAPPK